MNTINDNLNLVLNRSLVSVNHLKTEIGTIHEQVKLIAAPIQWTNNILSFFVLGKGITMC